MKESINFRFISTILGVILITLFVSSLKASVIVEINDLRPEQIKSAGFILNADQNIKIEAYGIRPHSRMHRRAFTYSWILNADTRDVVWELSEADRDRVKRFENSYEDNIDLKAGTYELYYAVYPYFSNDDDTYYYEDDFGSFLSNFFGAIFSDERRDYRRIDFEKLFIRVEGDGKALSEDEIFAQHEKYKDNALISFTRLRGEEYREQIFKVSKDTPIKIYAIGEVRRDGQFDFGWITNLETRERVWELDYRHSKNAGGSSKNRMSKEEIELKPGMYKAVYITDDSHHYNQWNTFPPYDPDFYGLTVTTENEKGTADITLLDKADTIESEPIVELTKVRDHEYRNEGFTLNKPLKLHIFALGEGRDNEMFDYGWIVNTKTREKVWTMKFRDTEPAGGDDKNRMFDGIVQLEPGNYMAYYVTDGSHAYHSWNTSPPFDEKHWGITITVMDENYSPDDVSVYKEADDPNVIAKIVRVGDDVRERQKFTMEKDGYVHVYAIGEGSRDEMYDYAYIENYDTGRKVWEMTYRKTDQAGGARKNRLFDDDVHLEAGTYYVIYRTDDSHSFEDWNEDPPYDPVNYGVTITRAK